MRIPLCLVIIALFATQAAAQTTASPGLKAAREAVGSKLSDPLAAQFRAVVEKTVINKKNEPMTVVCGEVNAKNVFGGYAGFAPFIYLPRMKTAFILGPDKDIATIAMIGDYCR